jgi:16S rRNA (uracil1498-N3)-methyltransferase
VVFDGRGREFDGTVERIARSEVLVRLGAPRAAIAREPRVRVTLVQAILKGDRTDEVVRDAVMMGAAAIQPVVAARSEVTPAAVSRGRRRDRWQRVAVASAKQSGRAVVPEVLEPVALDSLLGPGAIGSAFMFVEPGAAGALPLSALEAAPPDQASVFIGPEGGWSAGELERASAVAHLVTLGSLTFRADAVAVIAIAALFTHWKEY